MAGTSAYGNYITILSIDGGGVKGIIPGIILEYLESALQVNYNHWLSLLFFFLINASIILYNPLFGFREKGGKKIYGKKMV